MAITSYGFLCFLLVIYYSLPYSQSTSTEWEPKCSKFDFEEKVLEKIVRTEHATHVMMEEFERIKTDVKENLNNMKKEYSEIKQQLSDDIGKYQLLIQDYVNRPTDAFSAFWLASEDPALGDALIFSKTQVNEYHAYNKDTGEYTVPVNGTYIFLTTLCTRVGKWANVQFVAGSDVIGGFRAADRDWDLCTSSSATARLQVGMKVKITVLNKGSGTVFFNRENQYVNSFSGHLIK